MKLNDNIPGLPVWPHILRTPQGCAVSAKHITLSRVILIRRILTLAYFIFAFFLARHERNIISGVMYFGLLMIPFMIVYALFPIPRLLCWLFFPQNTYVHFTRGEITINGVSYQSDPSIRIQFRAIRPSLREDNYNSLRRRHEGSKFRTEPAYDLKFREVEMIYGARIVHIASVANPERAEQFAMALQLAHELVETEDQPAANSLTSDDLLPE